MQGGGLRGCDQLCGPGSACPSVLGSPPGAAGQGELRRPPVSPQLPTFIAKVLHTLCFIWATSEHYNTPSRIIVILREFCNQIIDMVASPWPVAAAPPPVWVLSPLLPLPRPVSGPQAETLALGFSGPGLGLGLPATQSSPKTWAVPAQPSPCWREEKRKGALPRESQHPKTQPGVCVFMCGLLWPRTEPLPVSLSTHSFSFFLFVSTH